MPDELPEGYDSMLDALADELERTDPGWVKEAGEALGRFRVPIDPAVLIDLLANRFDLGGLMAWVAMRWEDAGIPPDRWRAVLEGWLAGQEAPRPDDDTVRRLRAIIDEMAGPAGPRSRGAGR